MFVHLHNHSDYSLLDGACKIPDLVSAAVEQNAPAVGLTDHGNLFGALDFYAQAKGAGIKPIIGCEFYMAPKSRLNKKSDKSGELRYHQILIAKDLTGYKNLAYLSSEAYISGFYYKPRIDKKLLKEFKEGLICLSSCIQGEIPRLLVDGNFDAAREAVEFYKQLFGDDFYIELQRHGIEEQERIIPHLAELAEEFGIKLVATNDVHYLKREHATPHDLLLCIGTQSKRDDVDRMRFNSDEFYFKTEDEMVELFADYPDALSNTLEIVEKCNLEIDLQCSHYPVFTLPDVDGLTADEYLAQKAKEGFQNRYRDNPPERAMERLESELAVISQTGFANYFLIVWDFIRWAKEHDIPVGPGRGSAAGCLVSFCLGITNLDPIKYGLLFERFLNPERVSPPDIDIDFSDDRREEVITYVRDKYGENSVCRITTFGRMAAKSAVRDIARALNLSYVEADKIARLIPEGPKVTLAGSLKEVPELKSLVDSDPRYREVIDNALVIEGTLRHSSTHAAGVVICPGKTIDFIPVYKMGGEGEEYTQYDMNWVDKLGLLKMDFLGLQTLTELDRTIKSVRNRGKEIDLDNINLEDEEVFRLFGEGNTVGVFQFESSGMRDNLMKLKPKRLEDLIAMNALYRPGPMQMIDEFIDCSHGRKRATYLHKDLKPILQETYGVIVYQEQVMRIATDLAGFSLGKADNLRWAMGKKKMDLMKSLKSEFIDGCVTNKLENNTAESIYLACEQFANYGFVKAHSAGYALIAYQCAYLKVHYTADFLAACLTVRRRNPNQVMKLLAECRALGINILAPNINESEEGFVATPKGILFGLAAVKNLGDAAVHAIQEARNVHGPFTSLHHFLTSVDLRTVKKNVVESLIDAGAFDEHGYNRATLLASLPGTVAYAQAIHEERERGQTTLFGGLGVDPAVHIPPPDLHHVAEWLLVELQSRERNVLGYYITSHPLERFAEEIEGLVSHRLADKDEFSNGMKLRTGGVVTSARFPTSKKGDKYADFILEDLTGSIGCLIFSSLLQKCKDLIEPDKLVGLAGRVSRKDSNDEPKLRVEEAIPLEKAVELWGQSLRIQINDDQVNDPLVTRLEQVFEEHPGNCPVYIDLTSESGKIRKLRVGRYTVRPIPEMLDRLKQIVGDGQIQVSH